MEEHYYNAKHTKLLDLGLKPNLLTDAVIDNMLTAVRHNIGRVRDELIPPTIKWKR